MSWQATIATHFLNPSEVDLEDKTCLIPCFSDLTLLLKSIERTGILNHPLVQGRPDGKIIPVLGRRRLEAAVRLGLERVKVEVLRVEISEAQCFLIAFCDNVGHRSFDPACIAVVARRLLELFPRDVAARDYLSLLGVPASGPRLERLRRIGGLERPVLEALALGRIHEKTAALLTDLPSNERLALLEFTERLGLNANKKAEVIGNLFDLAVLRSSSVTELLQHEAILCILSNPDSSLQTKAAPIRDLIAGWKYPEMVGNREEFERWHRKLSVPGSVSIHGTTLSEGHECTIEIRAESRTHAEEILDRVRDLLQ